MLVERILREKGTEVASIAADESIRNAVAMLRQRNVGALLVTDQGNPLAGIISERDIVRALADHGVDVLDLSVRRLMTADVVTVDPHAPLDALAAIMTERRIRHVPVCDDQGAIQGIVSIGDVVKRRLEELETENAQIVDYIHVGR